jgi:hypothetical protein
VNERDWEQPPQDWPAARRIGFRAAAGLRLACADHDKWKSSAWPRELREVADTAEVTIDLLDCRPLGHVLLWHPLRLFEHRLPVHDLAALPAIHYAAPNHRLARLAGSETPPGGRGWVDDVYQLLDRDQPGLVATVEQVLSRHEKDVP